MMRGLIYFGILEYSNMLMDVGLLAYANMLIGAGGLARYMHGLRILTWINKKDARGVALAGRLAILTIKRSGTQSHKDRLDTSVTTWEH
jgi:hypothetical protein